MKRKILVTLTALLIFGMFAAVYAYQSGTFTGTGTTCCKHSKGDNASADGKDSCPMTDCCKDGHCTGDCCKDHDNCPMKDKQESSETADTSKVVFAGSSDSCCHKKS